MQGEQRPGGGCWAWAGRGWPSEQAAWPCPALVGPEGWSPWVAVERTEQDRLAVPQVPHLHSRAASGHRAPEAGSVRALLQRQSPRDILWESQPVLTLHQLSAPHRPRLSVTPSPSPRHSHSPPHAQGSTRPPRSRLAPGQRHNACCLPWSNLSMSRTVLSGPEPEGCKETKTGPQVRRGPPRSLPLALWGSTHPQA